MSKNYSEVSNQIICKKNKNHVLAFYANLSSASVERFAELVNGKIKVGVNDFSKGKGDHSVYASYNLELKDVSYLYIRATQFKLPEPFIGTKIIGNVKEQFGCFKGLSKVTKISITNNPGRDCPWNITIRNGYAEAANGSVLGSFYEKAGTFRETAQVYFNLSDIDFLECMEKCMTYIKSYTSLVAQNLIPAGLKAMEVTKSRSTYQKEGIATDVSASAPKPAETPLDLHPTPILISSPFQALNDGKAVAQCMIKGKTFNIFFEKMNDELIEAQSAQKMITANLYMDSNKRFWCHSICA